MFAYTSDPEVARFLSWDAHTDVEQDRRFIRTLDEDYARGEWADWGIELLEENTLVGCISLRNWEPAHAQADLSYAMNPRFGGKGLMTEAVVRLLKFCFEEMNMERVGAQCMADNLASQAVIAKIGMSYEGTLRRSRRIRGRFHDFKIYSILRDEYFARFSAANRS